MKISNSSLVSIVSPVYNGEKFLAESIESVLEQTYENWEYIILNNRSTDKTLEIAENYAVKDDRIKVITNDKFLKQIPNWNESLKKISSGSKYCKVLHADDCLLPECLEKMVARAEEYPSAGLISSYRFVGPQIGSVFGKGFPYSTKFLEGKEVGRRFLLNGLYLFGSPSTVMYRSDLIRERKPFYDPTVVHADTDICLDILRETNFAFVHQVLSFTRRHEESTTNFVDHYNTHSLFYLYALVKYGDYYLSDDEYNHQLSSKLMDEHRWVLRSLLKGREKEVLSYHKNELEQMGLSIEKSRLLKAFFREIAGMLRTDKIQAIKNRVTEKFKNTSSSEDESRKKIIEEKKRDTAI